ncbi:putative secreted protein [Achromobacter arsenitoxydans SY8]|uniref:Putative secreted protein n=1 Tax=Achromobacter arsenitoxydans SY8 TaxID=477184 RepID=H0F5L3_9BURK|nr:putative secreted protein [Achromobacter arsenitoxydans SY8]
MSQRVRFFSAPALRRAVPLLALLAAASSGPSLADTPAKSDAASNTSAPALRKLNPAPTHAYEIRLTLSNASDLSSAADGKSPFTVVEGVAQFDASNAARCGRSNALAGNVPTLSSHEPFRLSRISATEYIGTVYADMLLDEDYYGRGVCHWQLTEARVAVSAQTDSADSRFVAGLPAQKVLAAGTQARYFWKGYYPSFEQRRHTDYGRDQLDAVPADRRGEFFVMTLTSRKIAGDVQGR